MKYFTRIICLILSLCTVVGLMAIPASAADEEPDYWDMNASSSSMAAGASETDEIFRPMSEVPLYFQTDYPNTPYGKGTVKSSGCGITSLAMVATYLTGREYLPDELANRFGKYPGSNMDRMEKAYEELELPAYEKVFDWPPVLDALYDGKVIIVLLGEDSPFTESQHFIVLTGITPDGNIMVNDSFKYNYNDPDLQDGYENGFPEEVVSRGFSGAWVCNFFTESGIKKWNERREEERLAEEKAREDLEKALAQAEKDRALSEALKDYLKVKPYTIKIEMSEYSRYSSLNLSQEDIDLLAKLVCGEADAEPAEGQQAVAEVVFNRMLDPEYFGFTLKGVVLAEKQFSSAPVLDDIEPTRLHYQAIEKALNGPYVLPTDVVYFGGFAHNDNIWGEIGNHVFCYHWFIDTDCLG